MNIPVLNIWDETQKKYVGIPAITGGGDTGGVSEEMLDDAINDAINNALTDVSSQIQAHNDNNVAHSIARASTLAAARAYTDAEIAKIGDSIPEPVPKPLTRDYMPDGYPYIDPFGDRMFIYSGDYDGTKVSTTKASGIIEYSDTAEKLITGQPYVVTFNDVDYGCVCYEVTANKLKCLGNYKIHSTNAEDTGEPFFLMETARKNSLYVKTPIDNTDPFTLAINKAIPVTVPIDEEFLPDSVKCANAPVAEEISESATVLVEDGGEVKRVAKDKVGGGSIPNPIPYDYMPEGYPKKGMKEFTVETEGSYTYLGDDFPNFDVGDTVTVTVDGVVHSLVAFWDDYQDGAAIGDASDVLAAGTGLGWQICWGELYTANETDTHTVKWTNLQYEPIDEKFLPKGVFSYSLDSWDYFNSYGLVVDENGYEKCYYVPNSFNGKIEGAKVSCYLSNKNPITMPPSCLISGLGADITITSVIEWGDNAVYCCQYTIQMNSAAGDVRMSAYQFIVGGTVEAIDTLAKDYGLVTTAPEA